MRENVALKHKQIGRPVPPIPARLMGADMKKPIDRDVAAGFERDFLVLIDGCTKDEEYDINCRILDCMDEGKISSPQAHRLLKKLFRKFDDGPGMCRIDEDGNVHELDLDGRADGR